MREGPLLRRCALLVEEGPGECPEVGYGYRPWIALLWMITLVTAGTLVIMARPDAELTAGLGAPPRNALLYTVDML